MAMFKCRYNSTDFQIPLINLEADNDIARQIYYICKKIKDPNGQDVITIDISQVLNDSTVSLDKTYSSMKIEGELNKLKELFNLNVNIIKEDFADIENCINELETHVNENTTKVDEAVAVVTNAVNILTQKEADISYSLESLTAVDASMQSTISKNSSDISGINNEISLLKNNDVEIRGNLSVVQEKNLEVLSSLDKIKTDIAKSNNDMSTLQSEDVNLQGQIDELKAKDTSLTNDIQTAKDSVELLAINTKNNEDAIIESIVDLQGKEASDKIELITEINNVKGQLVSNPLTKVKMTVNGFQLTHQDNKVEDFTVALTNGLITSVTNTTTGRVLTIEN